MKHILVIIFTLLPLTATAEATGGYGGALDRLAALVFGSPIAGIIGAIVFSLTLKKLFYPGIFKYFLGLTGGIIGVLPGTNSKELVTESFALYMHDSKEHYRIHPKLLDIFKKHDKGA